VSFDTDLTACAALVERADPLRFRTAMLAPVEARRLLFPLYAFNVEVARAPWVTQEAMIAEMRLQWWRDVAEEIGKGGPVRRHEVATPLASAVQPEDATLLDELVAARRWDIYRDVVRDAGFACGVAAWLTAIPALEEKGRVPLLDGSVAGVRALAQSGLDRLAAARLGRGRIASAARPVLLPALQAEVVLKAAVQTPQRVADGALPDLDTPGPMFHLKAALGRW